MLGQLYRERHIEDLPLSFFCISANLTHSACMVHRTGLARRAVAASCAVRGLGPPVVIDRELLVDGGVVNNLPVDIMRGFGRGPVVASSVSPRTEMALDRDYPTYPSPWRLLASWINPFGKPLAVPGIATTIMRTVSLQQGSARAHAAGHRPGDRTVVRGVQAARLERHRPHRGGGISRRRAANRALAGRARRSALRALHATRRKAAAHCVSGKAFHAVSVVDSS